MLRRTIPLLALLALAGTACGFSVESGEASGEVTAAPGLPVADDGGAAGGGAAGGTQLTLPPMRAVHEQVNDATPRPFESARYDETDGSLHVIWTTGVEPCYVLAGIEVVQEPEQVTVTLLEGWLPDENGEAPVCIEIAEQASTPIPLEAPLDGRTLVDGASGDPVPVDVITAEDAASR